MSLWNQNNASTTVNFVQSLLANGGEVYGVVLNDKTSLQALGEDLAKPPYKNEPQAPAMYIKPRNTLIGSGSTVNLPSGEKSVEVGATLGVVIKQSASRLTLQTAQHSIGGYVAVADLSLPHDSYYRPAIREKCFDGSCPIGEPISIEAVTDLNRLDITTFVNDTPVAKRNLADLHRSIPQLLMDVSEFPTLKPGDILLTGVTFQAARAQNGDTVRVEVDQVGDVEFSLNSTFLGE